MLLRQRRDAWLDELPPCDRTGHRVERAQPTQFAYDIIGNVSVSALSINSSIPPTGNNLFEVSSNGSPVFQIDNNGNVALAAVKSRPTPAPDRLVCYAEAALPAGGLAGGFVPTPQGLGVPALPFHPALLAVGDPPAGAAAAGPPPPPRSSPRRRLRHRRPPPLTWLPTAPRPPAAAGDLPAPNAAATPPAVGLIATNAVTAPPHTSTPLHPRPLGRAAHGGRPSFATRAAGPPCCRRTYTRLVVRMSP